MYPTARAYRVEVFQYFFNQVKEASDQVMEWLENHHKLL
jgi:ATP-dependent Clp protease adapter protein ClpS